MAARGRDHRHCEMAFADNAKAPARANRSKIISQISTAPMPLLAHGASSRKTLNRANRNAMTANRRYVVVPRLRAMFDASRRAKNYSTIFRVQWLIGSAAWVVLQAFCPGTLTEA